MVDDLMSDTKRWMKLDLASEPALEHQWTEWAFAFLEKEHKNHLPSIAKRLKSKAVRTRGSALIRELITTYADSIDRAESEKPAERERASTTADALSSILSLLESIPDDHKREIYAYNEYYHDLLFSDDSYNIILACRVHFQRRSWKRQGRPPDLVMSETISACVRLLEYLVGRPFKRNFQSEETSSGKVFTNPDCAFCEGFLKLFSPSLEHTEIKAAIKTHFAPPRSRPVRYVGPSRKPIYGPQKAAKSK
jgi:hypothetical protein